jgi:hypothetical protein
VEGQAMHYQGSLLLSNNLFTKTSQFQATCFILHFRKAVERVVQAFPNPDLCRQDNVSYLKINFKNLL